MALFRRREDPHALVVRMTGLQMGERVLLVGCAHGPRIAAVAGRVGLSGRAVAVVFDEASAARLERAAERAGVLIELETTAPGTVPVEEGVFDLALIDDTAGSFGSLDATDRAATLRETWRALRPGGRVMVVSTGTRRGLGALLPRTGGSTPFDPLSALEADGFRGGRQLGDAEGLAFFEAVKPRV